MGTLRREGFGNLLKRFTASDATFELRPLAPKQGLATRIVVWDLTQSAFKYSFAMNQLGVQG